jgi:hypothetical protein
MVVGDRMKRGVQRRSTWPRPALAAVIAAIACHPGYMARYGPAEDDAAMAVILSTWTQEGGDLALSLCEDVATAEARPASGCIVNHVVRAGGVGLSHEIDISGGCGAGGCPGIVQAYVVGTIRGGGFARDVKVVGSIGLSSNSSDPYAFPYHVAVTCDDPQQPCQLTGTLAADGRLDAAYFHGDPHAASAPPSTQATLTRVGPSTCG